jgi:acetaldehyde dehydrogenase/alcohol dehydrogenase
MGLLDACPKIYFGRHSLDYLEQLPEGPVMLVCDPFMVESGIVRKVTDRLERYRRDYAVFSGVEPDPSIDTVTACMHMLFSHKPDAVIALGGGSAIDTAKATLYFCLKYKATLMGRQYIHKPFFVAVPTTSGTGSEVTSYTVLTDRQNDVKIPLNDRSMTPDVAVLDPVFTKTLPRPMIAYTGMDVLTHALEAYVTGAANSFTDMYAVQAAKGTLRWLPVLFGGEQADEAHQEMMISSTMAGLAFSNSGLGLSHGLAHTLGAEFHLPHGKANSIVLPYVICFNAGIGRYSEAGRLDTLTRYASLAQLLGFGGVGDDAVRRLAERVLGLDEAFGIPIALRDNGVGHDAFYNTMHEMVGKVMADITTGANPVRVREADVEMLLGDVYEGRNPLG